MAFGVDQSFPKKFTQVDVHKRAALSALGASPAPGKERLAEIELKPIRSQLTNDDPC